MNIRVFSDIVAEDGKTGYGATKTLGHLKDSLYRDSYRSMSRHRDERPVQVQKRHYLIRDFS
jgi:hypothetical protein